MGIAIYREHVSEEGHLVEGYEYRPGEVNERNVGAIQTALGEHDFYCVASGLHTDHRHALGAFASRGVELQYRCGWDE